MAKYTYEWKGKNFVGHGDDERSAHSDACVLIVVSELKEYWMHNGKTDPDVNHFKLEPISFKIHAIHYVVESKQKDEITVSITYHGHNYLGTGPNIIEAKVKACLNAAKIASRNPNLQAAIDYETNGQEMGSPFKRHPADILLKEYGKRIQYRVRKIDRNGASTFTAACVLDEKAYNASAETQREAKFNAARKALEEYKTETFFLDQKKNLKEQKEMPAKENDEYSSDGYLEDELGKENDLDDPRIVKIVQRMKKNLIADPNQPLRPSLYRNILHAIPYEVIKMNSTTPKCTLSIMYKGETFFGTAETKTLAKIAACANAAKTEIDKENGNNDSDANSSGFAPSINSEANPIVRIPFFAYGKKFMGIGQNVQDAIISGVVEYIKYCLARDPTKNLAKLKLHNKPFKNAFYRVDFIEMPLEDKKYVVALAYQEKMYQSFGDSKIQAKVNVFLEIARSVLGLHDTTIEVLSASASDVDLDWNDESACDLTTVLQQLVVSEPEPVASFEETIAILATEKYLSLTEAYPDLQHYDTLAAIVMSRGAAKEHLQVVSLATGMRSVSSAYLSLNGSSVIDCHAEVLARRGFIKFLFSQIQPILAPTSIFELHGTDHKLGLKSDVQFHLYVSAVPCGDASLFSPNEPGVVNSAVFGRLRTKLEHTFGTIPCAGDAQTWDGIMRGETVHTMSCSDKLARWNVLGLQGCLLTLLLKPIYLSSVIVGGTCDPNRLRDAIGGRIQSTFVANLPPDFRFNMPEVFVVPNERKMTPPRDFSVLWSAGDDLFEVISAQTGRQEGMKPSSVAKRSLYRSFSIIMNLVSGAIEQQNIFASMAYGLLKVNVGEYQAAKISLFIAFEQLGLGQWMKKPLEMDQFLISANFD